MKNLINSELRYRRLFETAQDGILILDAVTGMITDVNPFLINMLGFSREEFIEKKLWEVGAFIDLEASRKAFKTLQKNKYIRYDDLPLKTKDGRLIQVEFVSNVYKVGPADVIQCNIRDITERKQAQDALIKSEALLRELSMRDQLTGLFNRRYLEETLERELLRSSRNHLPLSLIMLDVDKFKYFNDTYGHALGDIILQELGKLLLARIRGEDVVCRYGGDEFLIVLPGASRKVTEARATDLSMRVNRLRIEFEHKNIETISLSMGFATYPEDGAISATLLKIADDSLYQSKSNITDSVKIIKQKFGHVDLPMVDQQYTRSIKMINSFHIPQVVDDNTPLRMDVEDEHIS